MNASMSAMERGNAPVNHSPLFAVTNVLSSIKQLQIALS